MTISEIEPFSLSLLQPLLLALEKEAQMLAAVVYGSVGQGLEDAKSDVDLLILCQGTIPSEKVRMQIYRENQGERITLHKVFENWETSWIPINDEFYLAGKKIEIGYNVVAWVDRVLQGVKAGHLSLPDFEFRPYTFFGLLENSICLFEKDHYFSQVKTLLRPYPPILKKNIIDKEWSVFKESVEDLEDCHVRHIGILAFQFYLFRALDAAILILFAINEHYYPASKREEQHLLRLPLLPTAIQELISEILPTFYLQQPQVIQALKEIKGFIMEHAQVS